MTAARILFVEDDPSFATLATLELKRAGHKVETLSRADEAAKRLGKEVFDLVLTDLRLAHGDGLQVLREAKNAQPETEVVVITGHGSVDSAVEAMKGGAFDYLTKPVHPEELALVVQKALEHRSLVGEVRRLREAAHQKYSFSGIVYASPATAAVLDLVKKVAGTDATVLVEGESGTGKELVARALHENSPRRSGAFVPINCGALPEGLLESELFGHVRGAFTGADRAKRGLFEEADGGTLFLDEIGEIAPPLQVKLLRALQEGEVRRVGDNHPVKISVRIVAATNKDLAAMVKAGKFREDLFYRLRVFPIRIPPLRERTEDILPLAEHFLRRSAKKHGQPAAKLSPEAAKGLTAYAWPGNVRELEHAVERALIMTSGASLALDDLPAEIQASAPNGAKSAKAPAKAAPPKPRKSSKR